MFTQKTLQTLRLPAGKSDHIEADGDIPGFGIRLRASTKGGASRTWIFQYKIGRQNRRMQLGTVSAIPQAAARDMASKLYARVRLGQDPAGEKIETRTKVVHTFGASVGAFVERQAERAKPRYLEDTRRYLEVHCRPLHGLALEAITRATIADLLDGVAKERGKVAADRCRAALSTYLGWLVMRGRIDVNPVAATEKHAGATSRDRVLDDAELAGVWHALPAAGDYAAIVRLLILTGQRREEIAALRWSEISLDKAVITLPADRVKNGLPHDVPLSPLAVEVLQSLPRYEGRDLVFGSRQGPFSGFSKAKRELDDKLGAMAPWVLHDLRRSVATGLGNLGVHPHVIEATLNHQSGAKRGVAGIYNRSAYAKEKAAALNDWSRHLAKVVGRD